MSSTNILVNIINEITAAATDEISRAMSKLQIFEKRTKITNKKDTTKRFRFFTQQSWAPVENQRIYGHSICHENSNI